jgi:hypothetical protein
MNGSSLYVFCMQTGLRQSGEVCRKRHSNSLEAGIEGLKYGEAIVVLYPGALHAGGNPWARSVRTVAARFQASYRHSSVRFCNRPRWQERLTKATYTERIVPRDSISPASMCSVGQRTVTRQHDFLFSGSDKTSITAAKILSFSQVDPARRGHWNTEAACF